MRPGSTIGRVALLAVLLTGAAITHAPDAHAHAGGAAFETLQAEEGADQVIDVRLRVRYSGDNEPAEGAILTATATSPTGRALTKVQFERQEGGIYRVAVRVDDPGRWVIDVTSAFPPGTTSISVTVGDDDAGPSVPVVAAAVIVAALAAGLVLRRRKTRKHEL